MPRALHDTALDTRTSRGRLRPRRDPYWRRISACCHLGYRRHQNGGGSWVVRFYDGSRYIKETIATADDQRDSDGAKVLTFSEAQQRAQTWFADQARRAAGIEAEPPGRCTVARCMAEYLDWLSVHRKSAASARYSIQAHVLPAFGKRQAASLTPREIRRWHQQLAQKPARGQPAKGDPPGDVEPAEYERRRKATANRVLAVFRAGLNFAYREGLVPSDNAWRRVRPFRGVDAPRIRFLEREEALRLLNACEPDFRDLVQGALLTGCRYGELTRLRVSDYSAELGSVYIHEAKSKKPRHVYLNDEGVQVFEALTAGRFGNERLFRRTDGEIWGKAHQIRRMELASEIARIEPAVSFHILRHTYASLYLMNGGDLPALAAQLGHSDTRMTVRHYGHLAESWRAEQARKHAPSFGLTDGANVVRLRRHPGSGGSG